jgi:hypothetical protein
MGKVWKSQQNPSADKSLIYITNTQFPANPIAKGIFLPSESMLTCQNQSENELR